MFRKLFTRRRGVALASVAFGLSTAASGMSLAISGAAGANTVIAGSGSNTIYQLDVGLSDLFNSAPGCNLSGGSPQPLDFSCPTPYATGGVVNQPGEDGETATLENPYNDVVYQEPALGSGNGVHQIQGNAGSGDGEPSTISYARSSALPANSHGATTNNYVQFAIDGVPWTHFVDTVSGGVKTPTATSTVVTLTLTDLQNIYNDHVSCTVGGVNYTQDWICFGAPASTHIDCYMAQAGSGTEGTWAAAMGVSATPPCLQDEEYGPNGVSGTGSGQAAAAASHAGLFENEVSSITSPGSQYYNNDINQAIYFFSYGKFIVECKSGKCPGASNVVTAEGEINKIKPSQTTIQGKGGGIPGTFPILRYLSNVYNNSSATGAPGTVSAPANQATLNFMSEYGFLCKASTATDIDPYTGYNYRAEIEATLLANGFFPIDTGYNKVTHAAGTPFSEEPTPLTYPAQITDANFQLVDTTYNQANPSGYCLPING